MWMSSVYVSQDDAEDMCRRMAREEGIFGGTLCCRCMLGRAQKSPSEERDA